MPSISEQLRGDGILEQIRDIRLDCPLATMEDLEKTIVKYRVELDVMAKASAEKWRTFRKAALLGQNLMAADDRIRGKIRRFLSRRSSLDW